MGVALLSGQSSAQNELQGGLQHVQPELLCTGELAPPIFSRQTNTNVPVARSDVDNRSSSLTPIHQNTTTLLRASLAMLKLEIRQ
jgi:hypothetical protein